MKHQTIYLPIDGNDFDVAGATKDHKLIALKQIENINVFTDEELKKLLDKVYDAGGNFMEYEEEPQNEMFKRYDKVKEEYINKILNNE